MNAKGIIAGVREIGMASILYRKNKKSEIAYA